MTPAGREGEVGGGARVIFRLRTEICKPGKIKKYKNRKT